MLNNFNLIRDLITFKEADNFFFFLQIVRRAKDHKDSDIKVKEKAIKTYFVTSKEYFDRIIDEVIDLCEHFGARAYINVGIKDRTLLQKMILLKYSEYNTTNTIINPFRIINRVAGELKPLTPCWLIDIDNPQQEEPVLKWLDSYFKIGKKKRTNTYLTAIVPTVQGKHLIVNSFNLKEFQTAFPDIDVHKNSMGTLLYYPKSIKV